MTELLAWSSLQYLYEFTQCAICENEPNVITFVLKVYFKNMDSSVFLYMSPFVHFR